MTKKITCPSLNPKCDGELRVHQMDPQAGVDNNKQPHPWNARRISASCMKCRRVWLKEHLKTEGIDINQVVL